MAKAASCKGELLMEHTVRETLLPHRDIAGVVLAGGRSTRMGIEKAHIHAYGQTQPDMLARTRALLGRVTEQVWISCRPDNPKDGQCIFDNYEGLGPFSGVYTALLHARDAGLQGILPLSCDLPFMDDATLLRLLTARDQARQRGDDTLMTTFFQTATGFIESLTAVYEVAAIPLFEEALARQERKLSRIIPPQRRTDIPYVHSEALPFFNLNYPADLEVFRRMLAALKQ